MSEEAVTQPETTIDVAAERQKPRLISILFYDFLNETKDGKPNVLGVFDRLFVDVNRKRTSAFGLYIRTAQTFAEPVKVFVFSPENTLTAGFSFSLDPKIYEELKPEMMQLKGAVAFDAPVEGMYWFVVSYQNMILGGTSLKIEFRDLEGKQDVDTRGEP